MDFSKVTYYINPWKLTWIPKIAIIERGYIFKTIIFGIYVRFRGVSLWKYPNELKPKTPFLGKESVNVSYPPPQTPQLINWKTLRKPHSVFKKLHQAMFVFQAKSSEPNLQLFGVGNPAPPPPPHFASLPSSPDEKHRWHCGTGRTTDDIWSRQKVKKSFPINCWLLMQLPICLQHLGAHTSLEYLCV